MNDTSTTTFGPVRFENGKAILLTGLRQSYTFENMKEIPALWGQFAPQIKEIPAKVGQIDYGVIINAPDPNKGFDYMAAVEISDSSQLLPGFTTLEIPAQRYAIFPHTGHVSTLCETIDAIFTKWLPGSGYELTGTPDYFERYGKDFNPETGSGDLELWVPVKS